MLDNISVPKSVTVEPGIYFLTWLGNGEIWLTNSNYYSELEKQHRLTTSLNWVQTTEPGFFEGRDIKSVVFHTKDTLLKPQFAILNEELIETKTLPIIKRTDISLNKHGLLNREKFEDSNCHFEGLQNWINLSERKCECGSESVGYTTHSTYCPKYDTNFNK